MRERFAHDAGEEVLRRGARHHEEVAEEQELATAVVQQRVVLTAEQTLERVLEKQGSRFTEISKFCSPTWMSVPTVDKHSLQMKNGHQPNEHDTFWSDFCAACGTMTGASRSAASTAPRCPSVKIVDRFFSDGFDEKKRAATRQGAVITVSTTTDDDSVKLPSGHTKQALLPKAQ